MWGRPWALVAWCIVARVTQKFLELGWQAKWVRRGALNKARITRRGSRLPYELVSTVKRSGRAMVATQRRTYSRASLLYFCVWSSACACARGCDCHRLSAAASLTSHRSLFCQRALHSHVPATRRARDRITASRLLLSQPVPHARPATLSRYAVLSA